MFKDISENILKKVQDQIVYVKAFCKKKIVLLSFIILDIILFILFFSAKETVVQINFLTVFLVAFH